MARLVGTTTSVVLLGLAMRVAFCGEEIVAAWPAAATLEAGRAVLAPGEAGDGGQCPSFRVRPLQEIELKVDRFSDVPYCSGSLFRPGDARAYVRKPWAPGELHWAASNLYHQPLYFDDTPLERYGQSCHPLIQPWISGAHFFATFPLVPYKMGLDRTHDCVYALGYYRPGSWAPAVLPRLPWELDAALFEAGTWLALIAILP